MIYSLLADLVVLLHFAFVLFALIGGLLALRWRWMPWLHLPALAWGAVVEFFGLYCPLTPLENELRWAAGQGGYHGGFIDHYLLPILYPAGLTRETQYLLGAILIVVNLVAYGLVVRSRRRAGVSSIRKARVD